MGYKIGLLGSKGTTIDFLFGFEHHTGRKITHVITLPSERAAASKVSFHMATALAERAEGSTLHEALSYRLDKPEDLAFFEREKLDLLFVIGWERLLPDSVLATLRAGAYGMHGSPYGLPRGRGRSPMNWSIIQGHNHFTTSLFRYTPGVDDGDVVGSQTFSILEQDDIRSLHHKNRVCMLRLAGLHLDAILDGSAVHQQQPGELPTFYPKRVPEDGEIDWTKTTREISRLVRAVAPPYPGGRTRHKGRDVAIFACQDFEGSLFPSALAPGTVVDVSVSSGTFVVKTGDGTVLVTSASEGATAQMALGDMLESAPSKLDFAELSKRYGDTDPAQWEVRPEV